MEWRMGNLPLPQRGDTKRRHDLFLFRRTESIIVDYYYHYQQRLIHFVSICWLHRSTMSFSKEQRGGGKYSVLSIADEEAGNEEPVVAATAVPRMLASGGDEALHHNYRNDLLTWKDTHFDNYQGVVAVFDYDPEARLRNEIEDATTQAFPLPWCLCFFFSIVPIIGGTLIWAVLIIPFLGIVVLYFVVRACVAFIVRRRPKPLPPHTAILETGFRHVEPTGAEIEVPFAEISAVKVHCIRDFVTTVVVEVSPPADRDAFIYTVRGIPKWTKVLMGSTTQDDKGQEAKVVRDRYQMCLVGLVEPIRFQQMLVAQKHQQHEITCSEIIE
jgi:hypothetical protein